MLSTTRRLAISSSQSFTRFPQSSSVPSSFQLVSSPYCSSSSSLPKNGSNSNLLLTRSYSSSLAKQTSMELIIFGSVIAGGAIAGQAALSAYTRYQANKPKPTPEELAKAAAEEASRMEARAKAEKDELEGKTTKKQSASSSSSSEKKAEPSMFASWFARNFYDGGFEEKMSKREAALILGIRESAPVEKVKEAHRRILLANHPDRGGSAFVSAKVNEAKDLLLKGKQ
jgi:DnaJ family protein C protein 19